ncbi:glutaredoxin-like protein C5orf63 homolog, partial [Austrofundulus limnaeus]|uniref:Glutaredoxin-like protein n=1 Tax=Austrofundulus limnaeus TaxID=52670 RepID=A0A2I4CC18_AUSLI
QTTVFQPRKEKEKKSILPFFCSKFLWFGVKLRDLNPEQRLFLRQNSALCRRSPLDLLRPFSTKALPTLTLFTKEPCPLCDQAKETLQPLRHRFVLQLVDISLPENREWSDRYRWDIPVFHLDGQFVMKHKVDLVLLDKLLQDVEKKM